MSEKEEENEYRNKSVINQRGGSLEINNSTDRESVKLTQYSGSNILMNNQVTSELATNNKQTRVTHDQFLTVGHNDNEYVVGDKSVHVLENNYSIVGANNKSEIDKLKELKEFDTGIWQDMSQFHICRGGESVPNGVSTPLIGSRRANPTLDQFMLPKKNTFPGYNPVPYRSSDTDQVVTFERVNQPHVGATVSPVAPTVADITQGSGAQPGSEAPGVLEFGAAISASTEDGNWVINTTRVSVGAKILELQNERNAIEDQLGVGGDDIDVITRHKTLVVGAINNDAPSMRYDPKGRSQPLEISLSKDGTYVNMDYVPHIQDLATDLDFPAGNYNVSIGNKYGVIVGSGGYSLRSSGHVELAGSTAKLTGRAVTISGDLGVTIASEENLQIQCKKTVTLRSNRQILVEPSLGVKDNVIVGGGINIEGETYVHHITAPCEVQQTEDTTVLGQFNTLRNRELLIGEALVGGKYWPVYALKDPDLIVTYPHSHHFNNVPLRLMESDDALRLQAVDEGINIHGAKTAALPTVHSKKLPLPYAPVSETATVSHPIG